MRPIPGREYSGDRVCRAGIAQQNGDTLPEIKETFTDQPIYRRTRIINAYEDPTFHKAFDDLTASTGRKHIIIAGITIGTCCTFPTLSLLNDGYQIFPVVDACGAWSRYEAEAAMSRMSNTGAESVSTSQIAARHRCSFHHINMTISLAFIAPALVKAALEGRLLAGSGSRWRLYAMRRPNGRCISNDWDCLEPEPAARPTGPTSRLTRDQDGGGRRYSTAIILYTPGLQCRKTAIRFTAMNGFLKAETAAKIRLFFAPETKRPKTGDRNPAACSAGLPNAPYV